LRIKVRVWLGLFLSMPELPEVQSTVDYLKPKIIGYKIVGTHFGWTNALLTHKPAALSQILLNSKIINVFRRAKYIVIELVNGHRPGFLLFHLRMSGSLEVLSQSISRDPYDRCWLELSNKKELRFNDVRKFGKVYYFDNFEDFSATLGIEPLSAEFNCKVLASILQKSTGRIKPLLLNQKLIAGIGNIYADECLWQARIHPATASNLISTKKCQLLADAIVSVLLKAIELKGTDNGDDVVSGGMYSPNVYGRHNLDCNKCGSKILKIFLAQRGTHFCPNCQSNS
jgi:formamidopyrimidine-DNA glycosylase